ncbi:hypothetical protein ACHAXR_007131 [Thalassiosira sp. AJA248-18]
MVTPTTAATNTKVAAAAKQEAPSPSSSTNPQRPRAADNAGMHSILAAAIGLSNLGGSDEEGSSPPPGKSSPSLTSSSSGAENRARGAAATQDQDTSPGNLILKPAMKKPSANSSGLPPPQPPTRPGSNTASMLAHMPPSPLSRMHMPSHYLPPYPMSAGARPGGSLRSIRPNETLHAPGAAALHHARSAVAPPLSLDARAQAARLSVADRVAATLDARAAAAVAASAGHRPAPGGYPLYSHPYPGYSSAPALPPLPTPHQTITAATSVPVPNTKTFPETLFDIISSERYAHIIAWLSHGRGFIIHDKHRFASMILPMYFDGAKFTSFTRRLKRWSFVRVPRGPELGAYYNKNFVRDDPELVQKMRYRMEGQFEEGKKKKGGSDEDEKEESEKMEEDEQVDRESDDRAQLKSPQEQVQEVVKSESPTSLPSKLEHVKHEHVAKIPSPATKPVYPSDPREIPMPLPSELPKPADLKRVKLGAASGPSRQFLRNHPSAASASLLPSGYPAMMNPSDPDERRLMEIERELLLSRSMMSHEAAMAGSRLGPSSIGAMPRSMMGSGAMAHHPYYAPPAAPMSTTHRMLEVQRAERILEAERVLARERHRPSLSMPPKVLTREEIMASAAQDVQSRLPSPFIPRRSHQEALRSEILSSTRPLPQPGTRPMALPMGYSTAKDPSYEEQTRTISEAAHRSDGVDGASARPIMMSRNEEEEFAEYLFMKRKGAMDLQAHSKR